MQFREEQRERQGPRCPHGKPKDRQVRVKSEGEEQEEGREGRGMSLRFYRKVNRNDRRVTEPRPAGERRTGRWEGTGSAW